MGTYNSIKLSGIISGINKKTNPALLNDTELSDGFNLVFDNGAINKRPGYFKWENLDGSTRATSVPYKTLYEWKNGNDFGSEHDTLQGSYLSDECSSLTGWTDTSTGGETVTVSSGQFLFTANVTGANQASIERAFTITGDFTLMVHLENRDGKFGALNGFQVYVGTAYGKYVRLRIVDSTHFDYDNGAGWTSITTNYMPWKTTTSYTVTSSLRITANVTSNTFDVFFDNRRVGAGLPMVTTGGLPKLEFVCEGNAATADGLWGINRIRLDTGIHGCPSSVLCAIRSSSTVQDSLDFLYSWGIYSHGTWTNSGNARFFSFDSMKNELIIAREGRELKRSTGHLMYDVDCDAPTSAPTIAGYGAGALNGNYYYKVTYVYGPWADFTWGESNGGTSSLVAAPAGQSVSLSNIPIGSATGQVIHRKLWRTTAGGSVFYYLTTISDNVTTTFSDNIPDTSLGEEIHLNHNAPPEGMYFITAHKNHLFGARTADYPSRVWFSSLSEPAYWPANNWIEIPGGDAITGIVSAFGVLVVFKEKSIHIISGDDFEGTDTDYAQRQTSAAYGCVAPYTIRMGENVIYFMSEIGVHAFSSSGEIASTQFLDTSKWEVVSTPLEPEFIAFNQDKSAMELAYGYYYKYKYYLSGPRIINTLEPETYNTRTFVLDPRLGTCWSIWFLPMRAIGQMAGRMIFSQPEEYKVYHGGYNYTFEMYPGTADAHYNDDGAVIPSYWMTKWFDAGESSANKVWMFLALYYQLDMLDNNIDIFIDKLNPPPGEWFDWT